MHRPALLRVRPPLRPLCWHCSWPLGSRRRLTSSLWPPSCPSAHTPRSDYPSLQPPCYCLAQSALLARARWSSGSCASPDLRRAPAALLREAGSPLLASEPPAPSRPGHLRPSALLPSRRAAGRRVPSTSARVGAAPRADCDLASPGRRLHPGRASSPAPPGPTCVAPGRLEPGRARPPRVPAQAPTRRLLRAASANRPAPGRLRLCLGRLRSDRVAPPAPPSAPRPAPCALAACRLLPPGRPSACRLQRNRPSAGFVRPRRLPHPTAVVGYQ